MAEKMSISFSPPDITEAEIAEVADALRSGWITTGPRVKELERRLAAYLEVPRCVCLNSQTACAEMALRVLGGHRTASAIAEFLFLNASDITSCLRNLEATGLITRQRSTENRRVRTIQLTDAGTKRLVELMPVVFDALHETCHSDDALIRTHISAARDLVARRRERTAV